MSKKHTIKFIKREFEKVGYKIISKEYTGAHSKLNYICSNNHKRQITWHSFRKGGRCKECRGIEKHNINSIKKEFEEENYILLSEIYINAHTPLKFICSNKHKHQIRYADWCKGIRCAECCGNKKPTIEDIILKLNKLEYKLKSEISYINNYTKFEIICNKGHVYKTTWKNIERECRCLKCYHKIGDTNPNWRGGISYEPYCSVWKDKEYKESIKQRDEYTCQNENCWRISKNLVIHHIDYNKKYCHHKNLITVCASCNSRANSNRRYWQKYYEQKIKIIGDNNE